MNFVLMKLNLKRKVFIKRDWEIYSNNVILFQINNDVIVLLLTDGLFSDGNCYRK